MSVALPGNAVAGSVVVIQESYGRRTFSGKVSDINVQATGNALDMRLGLRPGVQQFTVPRQIR